MKSFKQYPKILGTALILTFSAPLMSAPAFANGGGGGGGGSVGGSAAPSYDPVEEYKKGVEALRNNEFKKASSAFNRVLKVARKDANTNFYMGIAQTGMEKHKKAARYYKAAVKYDPDKFEAYPALTRAYMAAGKPDKASDVLANLNERAAECAGSCDQAAAIDETTTAVKAAIDGEEVKQESSLRSGVQLAKMDGVQYFDAVALINQEKYTDAVEDLTVLANAIGPHPDVMNYLGYSHRKMGQYDRAEYFYGVALSVDPNHKGANEYLGELYVETKQFEKAHAQLKKLEEICSFGCVEEDELRGWINAAAW